MMAVPMETTGATLEAGKPVALFPTDITAQPSSSSTPCRCDGRFIINNLQPDEGNGAADHTRPQLEAISIPWGPLLRANNIA